MIEEKKEKDEKKPKRGEKPAKPRHVILAELREENKKVPGHNLPPKPESERRI